MSRAKQVLAGIFLLLLGMHLKAEPLLHNTNMQVRVDKDGTVHERYIVDPFEADLALPMMMGWVRQYTHQGYVLMVLEDVEPSGDYGLERIYDDTVTAIYVLVDMGISIREFRLGFAKSD